jgi:hypothetical protein
MIDIAYFSSKQPDGYYLIDISKFDYASSIEVSEWYRYLCNTFEQGWGKNKKDFKWHQQLSRNKEWILLSEKAYMTLLLRFS